jgi:hypothetical protein
LEELQNAVFVGPRSSKVWSSRGFALTGHGFRIVADFLGTVDCSPETS